MTEYRSGEFFGWEYVLMHQSATILYDNILPMHFSASRLGHRYIIYQITRDQNIGA